MEGPLAGVSTRTITAMANPKGGGAAIMGIKEDPGRTADRAGTGRADFGTCGPGDIASPVSEYAEPPVGVVPHRTARRGKRCVVLDVEESGEVPIACKKDGRKSCRDHLRRGSAYHRPRRRVESTDRFDYADMREPASLAAAKQHALMHRQCAELYGMGSAAPPLASGAPGAKIRQGGRGSLSKSVPAGASAPGAPGHGYGSAIPERVLERIRGLGHRTVTMWPYPDPCAHPPGELARIVPDRCVAYRGSPIPTSGAARTAPRAPRASTRRHATMRSGTRAYGGCAAAAGSRNMPHSGRTLMSTGRPAARPPLPSPCRRTEAGRGTLSPYGCSTA